MLELDLTITQDAFRLRAAFALEPGARVALIGPSGAGKTTLMTALAGFVPIEGRISWHGARIDRLPPAARPFSILFQDHNLFPHLSLSQNTALALDPALRLDRAQWMQVEAALERVGLGGMGARRPGTLSGGQMGRAALARTLLRARPWVLLDEPFAALGPAMKGDMLDLVAQVAGAAGVIMITHDPADARRLCPQTVLVAEGIAHPPAPTQALLDAPPPALRDYLG
jgi:thiamine transport system ATP-binding protein